MVTNKYRTNTDLISTTISGNRPHHSYRNSVATFGNYEYELKYGESFHTLSAIIFGSDEYYWVLADINKPMDVFDMTAGTKIILPSNIVVATEASKRIF